MPSDPSAASNPVRVRFAPSPTGHLHIGGVRTALFNYLFAKHNGGQFILRIEDTDTERSSAVYTEDILKSLQWLGLNWDEGPIFQSQRFERYKEACLGLVASSHAYYCYCTAEQVEADRKALEAEGKKPMYSGKCRNLGHKTPDPTRGPWVIRLKTPREGATGFTDVVRGRIEVQNVEMDDFVLMRSNGSPTYNLACVVDDFDGKMTHIIRGDDHINNTPKQVLIFEAMGYKAPLFVHLPMILGPDKKKLSKRHGAVSANSYRADGYLPHATINYLARLGWGHGDQEIFSLEELARFFTLEKIGKSNAVFNTEKLQWLNAHYIREAADDRLARILAEDFAEDLSALGKISSLKERLLSADGLALVSLCKAKAKTVKDLAATLRPLLFDGELPLDETTAGQWTKSRLCGPLDHIIQELKHVLKDPAAGPATLLELGADVKTIETLYRATADRFGMKLVELAQPTRFLLQGATVGPQLFDVMARLPWALVERRLARYADVLK